MKEEPIRKIVFDNGLRLLTEYIPSVRSVSFGFWILGGSRLEPAEQNGITHFIEHMLFKGTPTRSAYNIATEIDSLGGHLDAFTSREYTCLLANVLDEHLPLAVDILADQLKSSLFPDQEIERERNVILEEICMIEDTPDEYVHDLGIQNFWPDQSLGRSVIGTRETVKGFSREQLLHYFHQNFHPSRIIIAAAGNIDHQAIQDLIFQQNLFPCSSLEERVGSDLPPTSHYQVFCCPRKLEQIHVCLMLEGLSQDHQYRYASYLLNSILGGGMSSRLFQKIREQQGLAYSVFSSFQSYQDAGMVTIYAGTRPDYLLRTVQLIMEELKSLKNEKVTEEELRRAKNQLKGSLMLGLESTVNRMSKLARQEIYFGRVYSLDEMIARIEGVTRDDILELGALIFNLGKIGMTVLGDIKKPESLMEALQG